NTAALVAQLALGGVLACTYLVHAYDYEKRHFSPASRPPFFGIWNVEEFLLGGKVLPPLETDGTRWQRVVFQFPTEIGIQSIDDAATLVQDEEGVCDRVRQTGAPVPAR